MPLGFSFKLIQSLGQDCNFRCQLLDVARTLSAPGKGSLRAACAYRSFATRLVDRIRALTFIISQLIKV